MYAGKSPDCSFALLELGDMTKNQCHDDFTVLLDTYKLTVHFNKIILNSYENEYDTT